MRTYLAVTAVAAVLASACTPADNSETPAEEASAQIGAWGIDTAQIDADVRPGDDFFEYVNGKWLATFEIPADKSRYGVFDELRDQSEEDVHAIVTDVMAESAAAGSTEQKVGDLYASWMDEATVEARGLEPLQTKLAEIEAISSTSDLQRMFGKIDYSAPFTISILPDPADTTRYTISIDQSGLGMPDRDYYLAEGDRFETYRTAYRDYVERIFELLGDAEPALSAAAVISLENEIAGHHWTRERSRNLEESLNAVTRAELDTLVPAIDWDIVLAEAGVPDIQTLILAEISAIRDSSALIDTVPLETWKTYLRFHIASTYAAYLPAAFDNASFDFYSKTIRGIEEQRERWKRGVTLLDLYIGEGLGELYVDRHFPPENKAQMDELVRNLRASLRTRLEGLEWMDDETRTAALTKLSTFEPRIGYPDTWRDYSGLTVEPDKLFENVEAARQFEWNRQLSRINDPVDRAEWEMNPQTVNAYYNPLMNQITFPAAILQPPFFDPNADPAVNYGAIGAVIGHEIGHGFDDQGRQFDESGTYRNWWTAETDAKFKAATDRFAAQYDSYCPFEDTCVNGRLTMGENIGDLGGLEMAYTAYQLSLNGEEAPEIDGFTGDQRFFMSWAQVWRALQREDAARAQILTDPHSPAKYRVNGVVRNMDAWYEAFDVSSEAELYLPPEERVRIW